MCFLFGYITGSGNSPHFKVKSMLSIIRSVCSASCENGKQFSFAVRVGLFKMSWFNITPPIALYADLWRVKSYGDSELQGLEIVFVLFGANRLQLGIMGKRFSSFSNDI